MSQADYTIADQDGASFLVDINAQLAAIVSNNSGATEPATKYAYQWWADTSSGFLKIRNAANNAWVTVGTLGAANLGLLSLAGGTLTGALNESQGADIASAATVNLTTATGNYVHVTGTTTITAITLDKGYERTVVFDGVLTLTNGASLILPGGQNIITAAGHTAIFRGEAAGVVRCISYTGYVGEYISSDLPQASAVSLASTISKTITSISLTAGDWDISGNISFLPAATTTQNLLLASISDVNNTTDGTLGRSSRQATSMQSSGGLVTGISTKVCRFSLSATTTIYLVANASFSTSTMTAYGNISARRVK